MAEMGRKVQVTEADIRSCPAGKLVIDP